MRYEELPEWSDEIVARAIETNDVDALLRLVVSVSMDCEDFEYAQELCVRLSGHPDFNVRGNAILGFGHIARVHGRLDEAKLKPIIEAGRSDPEDYVRGQAFGAMEDTRHFLGWTWEAA